MKNNNDKIIVCVFFIILFTFLLLLGVSRGGKFSPVENRNTMTRPDFSVGSLLDGEYVASLDKFYADNLPFKETFAKIKAVCELSMCKLESNGIIVLDRLIEKAELSDSEFEKSADALEKFKSVASDNGITVNAFIIPQSGEIKGEGLILYKNRDKKEKISTLSLTPDMYFRTDHHLNGDGAWQVYSEIAEALSSPVREKGSYLLSDSFLGRSYYTSALPVYPSEKIYTKSNDLSVKTYIDGNFAFDGFIDYGYIGTADEYSAFFGSNHAECYSVGDESKETVLVIKDSYALAVCPYLLDSFNVAMVDARYAKRGLSYYIDKYKCKRVIILCGREHFESRALRSLLSEYS